jgi:hypothetical protein
LILGGGDSMSDLMEKSGKLKMTVELEVNEELMGLFKDAMEKMPNTMRGMWKKGNGQEKNE